MQCSPNLSVRLFCGSKDPYYGLICGCYKERINEQCSSAGWLTGVFDKYPPFLFCDVAACLFVTASIFVDNKEVTERHLD